MQRYGLGIMVVWWTLLGMALAAEQPQLSPTEMVHVGHRYFVRYCSACHGLEGRGDGPAASALQSPPADLTRIAQRRGGHFPVAEIRASIDGRTVVPDPRGEMQIQTACSLRVLGNPCIPGESSYKMR